MNVREFIEASPAERKEVTERHPVIFCAVMSTVAVCALAIPLLMRGLSLTAIAVALAVAWLLATVAGVATMRMRR
jgi:hypothetical protein